MSSLDQIVEELKKQNSTLESTKDSIQKMLSEDINARKARERAAGREEENRREARQQRARAEPTTFKGGLVQGAKQATGFNFLEEVASWGKSILAGLFGGATAGAIAAGLGALVSRGAIFGGAAYLIGQFGERIFTDFFKSLDPKEIYLKADDRALLAASMSDAVSSGLVGLIFGKKAGIAAFVGSLIGDGLTKLLNLSDTERMKIFGMDLPISEADFASYGAMIAAYFGPGLIGSALSRAFTGQDVPPGATVGRDKSGRFTKLKPQFRKTFMANFKPRLGWAAVITTAGSLLANYIGDMTGSSEMADVANWTTMGASFGMMFGPGGALAGAVLGFAFSAGGKVLQYLTDMRKQTIAKLNEDINRLQSEADAKIKEGAYNEAREILRRASAKSDRLTELQRGQLSQAEATQTADQRSKVAELGNADVGERRQSAIGLFEAIMADSNLSDVQKIAKANTAILQYMRASAVDRETAVGELLGELGGRPTASNNAMRLLNDLMTNKSSSENLSSRLDRKGGTPAGARLSDVVGGVAGAVAPPVVIADNSVTTTQVRNDATMIGETVASARDATVYSMP